MANTTAIEGAMLSANHHVNTRQPSPNRLTLNLSSNNPFRNRATSPSPGTPPQYNRPPPAMSTNPFLDNTEVNTFVAQREDNNRTPNSAGLPTAIFNDLSLLDRAPTNGTPPPPYQSGPAQRSGTLPPPVNRPPYTEGSRVAPPRPPRGPPSPAKADARARPRGMSESSVIDERERRDRRERERRERPERTESEERRRRERRKEREERHRREKEKARNGGKPSKRPQGLDIIDKLDVTGIYGPGLFHHDGPFDACNPHRNKGKSRRPAPMQAFPADSANMALGGSGPLRSRIDLDKFHGRGEEGFSEYASTKKADTPYFNPTDRAEQIHSKESSGLGTSTFLEGAPASRKDLQRRESVDQTIPGTENNGLATGGGGLSRKKSLAQRFRGMSNNRRGYSNEMRSPDARYNNPPGELFDNTSPNAQIKAQSAGGLARARYTRENEMNPFDNEYDSAFDKKGAQIRIAEQAVGRARAGSGGPRVGYALARSVTSDSAAAGRRGSSNEEERERQGSGSGLLSRMKSFKGGRRARPERREG